MNREFQKRHDHVIETLRLLTAQAHKRGETLVFVGGSALQAALPKPLRLSIDLDIAYLGESEELVSTLKPEYAITDNGVSAIFHYYRAGKNGVITKIDVTKAMPPEGAYEVRKITGNGQTFTANIATPEYLLASKLTALSIGTIGRQPDQELRFLKDVFDADALIGLGYATLRMWGFFEKVCEKENLLRGTTFTPSQVAKEAVKALLAATPLHSSTTTGASALSTFQEYLIDGRARQTTLSPAFIKTAAYLAAYARDHSKVQETTSSIEKKAASSLTREMLLETEKDLISHGADRKLARELRITAPRALVYYHWIVVPPAEE